MPVLTATQKTAQFDHVIKVLLGKPDHNTPIVKALKAFHGQGQFCQDVDGILALLSPDIDTLVCDEEVEDLTARAGLIQS